MPDIVMLELQALEKIILLATKKKKKKERKGKERTPYEIRHVKLL